MNILNEVLLHRVKRFINESPQLGRKESFLFTMEEISNRFGRQPITILETGTTRKLSHEDVSCDGGSTILWGFYASLTGSKVVTCDISKENIEECKRWTAVYFPWIEYIVADSLIFLTNYSVFNDNDIDLLYLDSYDSSSWDRSIIEPACKHQLAEIQSAADKLHNDSLVLLDDVPDDFVGGKSELSIPWMLENGFVILNHCKKSKQVLLSRSY